MHKLLSNYDEIRCIDFCCNLIWFIYYFKAVEGFMKLHHLVFISPYYTETKSKYLNVIMFNFLSYFILYIWSGYKGVSGIVLSYPLYDLYVFFSVAVRLSLFLNNGWFPGGTVWYKWINKICNVGCLWKIKLK